MPLRYSPQRIRDYDRGESGPGHSPLLSKDIEAWNLAFLSHPYEHQPNHPNAAFTVLVRQTVNTALATGLPDRGGTLGLNQIVRGMLQQPAKAFLGRLAMLMCPDGRLIEQLPLYQALGDTWIATMHARARLCLPERVADESQPGDTVLHVHDAAALLDRIRRLPAP